jgi:3alpha(or 20beta)-hydroxysteroid dehydrogenase
MDSSAIGGLLIGKTVLVTGAARGLGAAIAATCIAHGADVILTDVLADELAETVSSLGSAATGVNLDVSDPAAWDDLVEHLLAGRGRPDVLVNNAGIITSTPLADTPRQAFQRTLDVNLGGAFLGTQAYVRLHRESGCTRPGSIVNIASVRGMFAGPGTGAYSASKFAIRGITKVAAVELGELGIRVNAVCPGPIATDMTVGSAQYATVDWDAYAAQIPLRRLGAASDVGQAVAWLGSDASSFITGIDLVVDGGLTALAISAPQRELD